ADRSRARTPLARDPRPARDRGSWDTRAGRHRGRAAGRARRSATSLRRGAVRRARRLPGSRPTRSGRPPKGSAGRHRAREPPASHGRIRVSMRSARLLAGLIAAAAVLALPAAAKEGVRARLDAHVRLDTAPGKTMRVAWHLFDEKGRPFGAGGIYLRVSRCGH